jgi:hypothetical protein
MTSERRADKRFLPHSPVKITGVEDLGLQLAERSRLEDVGALGCHFSTRITVHQGGIHGEEPLGPAGENFQDEHSRLFVTICRGDRLTVGARSLREDELSDGCFHANCSNSKVLAK